MNEPEKIVRQPPLSLVNNLPGIAYRFVRRDKKWLVDYFSDGVLALTEYPPDEFVGKPVDAYDAIVHQLDRRKIKKLFKKIYASRATTYAIEYRIHTRSGKTRWVSEKGMCHYDPDGSIALEEGFIADISDHKRLVEILRESENRFRSVTQSAQEAILTFDDDGNVVFWNKGAETLFGYPEGEIWGTSVTRIIPEKHVEDHHTLVKQLRIGQSCDRVIECHAIRKDGVEFPVELTISSWISRKQPFYTAIIRDVSARKATEEAIRTSEEDARKAYDELSRIQGELIRTEKSRALGEMAAGVAHQFNNILMMVNGLAELGLTHIEDRSRVRQYLEKILITAQDGANIVRRIQTFARRTQNADLKPVPVNECIIASIQLTSPKWKGEAEKTGRSIAIHTDLEDVAPVMGVESELREVIVNIIMNAVDAMPEGGALTVGSREEDGNVLIRIADTGIGIPPENLEKIFLPFFSTKVDRGTGLGLSICQNIITQFKGTITVTSERSKGAVFTITLPAAPSPSATPSKKKETDIRKIVKSRILAVDDEESICEIMDGFLTPEGHRVVTATNPRRAIEMFQKEPFDLVITDLGMSPITGWDLLKTIRAHRPETKTIILTGWGGSIGIDEARARGADAILSKPIDRKQLLKVVQQVLSGDMDGKKSGA